METYRSLAAVQSDLKSGSITCVQLVEGYLARIEANSELNVFLEVFRESALEKAAAVDQKIAAGTAGKLAGMVLGLKDNICYKGHKLSAASKILEGFESLFDATVVERLLADDVIIIGRINCDEFAMGSSNENSAFGNVLNPLDTSKVPGGSSGGSAAAVQAGLCLATLGSDTGGSIRQPASFCGVVGLKPTYGRVSRYGLIAYASSMDQIGPLTNNVADAAAILESMAGADDYDATVAHQDVDSYSELLHSDKKYRIAYIQNALDMEGLDPEVKSQTEELITSLQEEGHTVEPVTIQQLDYLVPTYFVLSTAEASSNLSRFDGIHFGYRSPETQDIPSAYSKSRTEGFGEEVKRRIMLGTFVLSSGYYDAYYSQAQKVRRLIQQNTLSVLEDYDFILSPTTPHPAFGIGANANDPIAMYLEDVFTVQANLAGVPSISLPLHTHSSGLPVGTQLMGRPFKEAELLAFSNELMNS